MVYKIFFSSVYDPVEKILLLVAFLFSAMFAITLHEYAHGFAALKLGDNTAQVQGRLSLNPLEHFEPVGLIMFLLVGFGFARPVPINPNNFENYKKGMLITSFAGVIANLIQTIIGFGLMIGFGYLYIRFTTAKTALYYLLFFVFEFSLYLTLLNAVLICFNLLPIFPLDGFRVVEALVPPDNGYVLFMRKYGSYILIGIVAIGFIFERIGIPQGDIFGMYLSAVQEGILKLYKSIMGGLLT